MPVAVEAALSVVERQEQAALVAVVQVLLPETQHLEPQTPEVVEAVEAALLELVMVEPVVPASSSFATRSDNPF